MVIYKKCDIIKKWKKKKRYHSIEITTLQDSVNVKIETLSNGPTFLFHTDFDYPAYSCNFQLADIWNVPLNSPDKSDNPFAKVKVLRSLQVSLFSFFFSFLFISSFLLFFFLKFDFSLNFNK